MSHQATCHSATAVALTGTALAHWHCATATVADWQCPVPSATHCQWQHWSAQHWHCDWQWHWQAGRCLPVGSHCHHVTMSLHVGIGGGRPPRGGGRLPRGSRPPSMPSSQRKTNSVCATIQKSVHLRSVRCENLGQVFSLSLLAVAWLPRRLGLPAMAHLH